LENYASFGIFKKINYHLMSQRYAGKIYPQFMSAADFLMNSVADPANFGPDPDLTFY
jgi:hypothetical protein